MVKTYVINDIKLPPSPLLRPVQTPAVRATGKVHFTLLPKGEVMCSTCRHPIQAGEPCLFCATLASKRAVQKAAITRRLAEIHELDADLAARAKARGE